MLVPSAATRPSQRVAEQFRHRLLMRDRPRAALSDPLPVFPEGSCRHGRLVWVSAVSRVPGIGGGTSTTSGQDAPETPEEDRHGPQGDPGFWIKPLDLRRDGRI